MKKYLLLLFCSLVPFLTGFYYSPAPDQPSPVGHLFIPSQNIDEDIYLARLVNRQWDRSVWDNGNVAWLDQTGWIDSNFNTVLVSHTDGPLHDILWLAVGDIIYVEDDQYIATYSVTETIITGVEDVLAVTRQSYGPMLTMSVCWGVNQRYIVRAERITLNGTND